MANISFTRREMEAIRNLLLGNRYQTFENDNTYRNIVDKIDKTYEKY